MKNTKTNRKTTDCGTSCGAKTKSDVSSCGSACGKKTSASRASKVK